MNNAELVIVSKPNDQFDIILNTDNTEDLTFNLFNMLGQQLVYDVVSRDSSGQFKYDLDMSYAATGTYIVKIGRGTSYQTGKIIVR